MSGINLMMLGAASKVRGCQVYTTAGTYTWVAPTGVTKVSIVAVGPGNNIRGGGGLGYKNNYAVTPGNSYTVRVGAASGLSSYFCATSVVNGGAGTCSTGGTYTGDGGGNGGGNAFVAGGGAGGYSGTGGSTTGYNANGTAGTGGAGGGGGSAQYFVCCVGGYYGAGGGGVGLYGQGTSGAGGTGNGCGISVTGGGGGSGGNAGANTPFCSITSPGGGGTYGGGGGFAILSCIQYPSTGAGGAVRIVWPGCARSFPSTDVA